MSQLGAYKSVFTPPESELFGLGDPAKVAYKNKLKKLYGGNWRSMWKKLKRDYGGSDIRQALKAGDPLPWEVDVAGPSSGMDPRTESPGYGSSASLGGNSMFIGIGAMVLIVIVILLTKRR